MLRARGLRSTPQRRAILGAFRGGAGEHLSADEVHARASRALPDLGRGTVYATLAEFTELGLLAAFGSPEPVRYETNTEPHDHFRCRLCLRLFDLDDAADEPPSRRAARLHGRADRDPRRGRLRRLRRLPARPARGSARAIAAVRRPAATRCRGGLACRGDDGPLGTLLLAASAGGPAPRSRSTITAMRTSSGPARPAGRGSQAARGHLDRAAARAPELPAGHTIDIRCPLDWDALAARDREGLAATRAIPYGEPSLLRGARQRRSRLRRRPDHGRQPDPDRRALPPRDPRDRAPAGLRRRASSAGAGSTSTSAATSRRRSPGHGARGEH